MAQFTVKSLARLLAQVEREVLVGALEEAGLSQLLTSESIETLKELQGLLNLATNVRTFGPSFLAQDFDAAIALFLQAAPITSGILSTVSFFVDEATRVNRKLGIVQEFLDILVGKDLTPSEIAIFKIELNAELTGALENLGHVKGHLGAIRPTAQDRIHALRSVGQAENRIQESIVILADF